jgi:arabinan endo-1,5-alpha-L-arabinosidase
MKRRKFFKNTILPAKALLLFVLMFGTGAGQRTYGQNKQKILPTYTNPVLNVVFADPSVIKAPNGWFYAYSTRTWHKEERMVHLQIAKSRDLVHWQYLKDGMPVVPSWADSTHQFWAPDIHYDKKTRTYYLYFASAHNGTNRHCIGVATSKSPAGPFKDIGYPLVCGAAFSHIDPMVFEDPKTGKRYILWGSDHYPIQIQQMEGWRKLAPNTEPHNLLLPAKDKGSYDSMLEGPWVIYHHGYYYLFTSGDNCCGVHAHYAVIVARSKSLMGPYKMFKGVDGSGNGVILEKNSHWVAPGHNAIITTDDGKQYWTLYHAVNPAKRFQSKASPVGMRFDRRVMLLDRIVFKNGWPRIENNSPSFTPQAAPIIINH